MCRLSASSAPGKRSVGAASWRSSQDGSIVVEMPLIDISSTADPGAIAAGHSIRFHGSGHGAFVHNGGTACMNRKALMEAVKAEMPERRWKHTLGVMDTAIIGRTFWRGPRKGRAGGHFATILRSIGRRANGDDDPRARFAGGCAGYDKELWHAPVGAWVAEQDYGRIRSRCWMRSAIIRRAAKA